MNDEELITATCPKCGHRSHDRSLRVGDQWRCPACEADNVVPSEAPESASISHQSESDTTHQDYPALTFFQYALVLAGFLIGGVTIVAVLYAFTEGQYALGFAELGLGGCLTLMMFAAAELFEVAKHIRHNMQVSADAMEEIRQSLSHSKK